MWGVAALGDPVYEEITQKIINYSLLIIHYSLFIKKIDDVVNLINE